MTLGGVDANSCCVVVIRRRAQTASAEGESPQASQQRARDRGGWGGHAAAAGHAAFALRRLFSARSSRDVRSVVPSAHSFLQSV